MLAASPFAKLIDMTPTLPTPTASPVASISPVPSAGRTVHYTMDRSDYRPGSPYLLPYEPRVRPAVIVEVQDAATGLVNLQVMVDGANDGYSPVICGTLWRPSCAYSPTPAPGKWSWPAMTTVRVET